MAAGFHFLADPLWSYNPAYKYAGQQRDKRHQEAVADIIHKIQKLSSRSIRQLQFKVKDIISQTDQDGSGCRDKADYQAHFFS